jgi:hypothetical protein
MADSLSAKTQEQVRALCHKISVAHDLDPEIQEELYGHMEDKLLAYLTGQEPLTEEDAFILVREHFGDPAVLKVLLQDVHAHAVHGSLARRLVAAAVVSLVLLIGANAVRALVTICAVAWASSSFSSAMCVLRFQSGVLAAGTAVLMWILLRRWQRHLDAGKRLWFVRWAPISLCALVACLLIINALGPTVVPGPVLAELADRSGAQRIEWPKAVRSIGVGILFSITVAQCSIWLWWCGRGLRRTLAIAYAFMGWYVLTIITSFRMLPVPWVFLYIVDSVAGLGGVGGRVLAEGDIAGSSLEWLLVASTPHLSAYYFGNFYYSFLRMLVLGAVALVLYVLAQRVRRRNARARPTGVTGASHG